MKRSEQSVAYIFEAGLWKVVLVTVKLKPVLGGLSRDCMACLYNG